MPSYQDTLARAMLAYQNKLMDFNVEITGTKVTTVLLEIEEDKYHNEGITIKSNSEITCIFNFPNNEIPVSMSSAQDNTASDSTNVLHLYDILPITCFFKTSDLQSLSVIKGSVVLYKIKMIDGNFQVIPFQITDAVAKGNPSSAILWQEFTVAPVTS